MSRVYIASPFFNETEIAVRDAMVERVKERFGDDMFRPDLTEASRSYDKSPGDELGRTIFQENISHIVSSDVLVFPLGCKDVGTLFEVGVALKRGMEILGYKWRPEDELREIVRPTDLRPFVRDTLIQVETLSSSIVLGYNYDTPFRTYYVLGEGIRDNLMLRFMGKRVEFKSKGVFEVRDFDIKEAA
jgi:nucleoside 2-deoxyribosyltransferase